MANLCEHQLLRDSRMHDLNIMAVPERYSRRRVIHLFRQYCFIVVAVSHLNICFIVIIDLWCNRSVRSKKYDDRTNSGDVVCRFGDGCDSSSWKTNLFLSQNVEIADEFDAISTNVLFMYEMVADRIKACQKHADIVSMDILKNNGIEFTDEVNYDSVMVCHILGFILFWWFRSYEKNFKLNSNFFYVTCYSVCWVK